MTSANTVGVSLAKAQRRVEGILVCAARIVRSSSRGLINRLALTRFVSARLALICHISTTNADRVGISSTLELARELYGRLRRLLN
jgi:hypothetical protein